VASISATTTRILVVGIIAGAIARLVVPGKQNLSIGMTIVLIIWIQSG